jgi:hypothetical protein
MGMSLNIPITFKAAIAHFASSTKTEVFALPKLFQTWLLTFLGIHSNKWQRSVMVGYGRL